MLVLVGEGVVIDGGCMNSCYLYYVCCLACFVLYIFHTRGETKTMAMLFLKFSLALGNLALHHLPVRCRAGRFLPGRVLPPDRADARAVGHRAV